MASAHDTRSHPFPNPTFKAFSDFILATFNSNISLTTVLLLLFSLTDNPDLLNLHARQFHPLYHGERKIQATGWIKALARGIQTRLGDNKLDEILPPNTYKSENQLTTDFGNNLHHLADFLRLTPYTQSGNFKRKIHHISKSSILPIRIICPPNMTCTTSSCQPYSIQIATSSRDFTNVFLIEGITVTDSKSVYLISGKCTRCNTLYQADHEDYTHDNGQTHEVFINSARYLKIGSRIWVDRIFSNAVLGGMYNFHASANAYMQYWNQSFGSSIILSQRHIWQAFVQESIQLVAQAANIDFEAERNLNIHKVSYWLFLDSLLAHTFNSLLIWHSKTWAIKGVCLWLRNILVLNVQSHESHRQASQILWMPYLARWL